MFSFDACKPDDSTARVGWICSYTPEELIVAAGFVPVRLSADERPPEGAEAYLPANLCPYVRSLAGAARSGDFESLDGIVFALSCDAVRRLADVWSMYFSTGFLYRIDIPRRRDQLAEEFFVNQLESLWLALEKESGRKITDEDIRSSIKSLNKTRELLGRLTELRSRNPLSISGEEFFSVVRASMTCEKERFNVEAERYLSGIDIPDAATDGRPRLLLCGCIVDSKQLLSIIEGSGATVVTEDLCTSLRHYEGLVDSSLAPLRAIARRYLHRASCARMSGAAERSQRILELVRKYNADGVIYHTLKFCDLGQSDLPRVTRELEAAGIPLLNIDRDYAAAESGQLKTRLEAFAELIGNKRG